MAWEHIALTRVGRGGRVARLALDRPAALNATCDAMIEELCEAADAIEADPGIRAVLFCGNGRAFCAGGDLKEQAETRDLPHSKARMEAAGRAALRLVGLDRPVVGAVQGSAVGAGFSLAMVGDIVYAADNAKFGALFTKVGLGPDMGTSYLLPRLVGAARAKELVLTGRLVGAEEAERIGLVNRVYPLDQLEDKALELAEALAEGSPMALRLSKQTMARALDLSFQAALDLERQTQTVCFLSEDHAEGLSAFLEKRSPLFPGR